MLQPNFQEIIEHLLTARTFEMTPLVDLGGDEGCQKAQRRRWREFLRLARERVGVGSAGTDKREIWRLLE
ncbi:MAG: hypothetical protein A2289_06220 [Deltaproteobacteria bacterium RIFOXYA12_FULL_58_15]|nr:MAG: hypothetical protein A2289_06220 [Deltaproteobacteria bacterium RIFOXYA12_FULL_58_15]OGR09869.1 MAG: hypothetical protein A2341_14300 [Deltaproteobacteria bacterium RIFOXYB12_FULL_58_9]